MAGNARPVQLRDGRLVVTTSSSAWAQTLQLMSEMVRARLNERLGDGSHRAGGVPARRVGGGRPAPTVSRRLSATENAGRRSVREPGRGAGPSGTRPRPCIENGQTEFSPAKRSRLWPISNGSLSHPPSRRRSGTP